MALESVVDIEVNDEQFQRFSQLFDRYKDALGKMPDSWKKVGGASAETASQFERMTAALMAQGQLSRETASAHATDLKLLRSHETVWKSIRTQTSGILGNVLKIGSRLARWGVGLGALGLGLGGGTFFGLGKLAEDVSNRRKYALGTFSAIGQPRAFDITAGRYFQNPTGVMTDVSQALHTIGPGMMTLRALGIGTGGTTFSTLGTLMGRLQTLAKAFPPSMMGNLVSMYGLGTLGISAQDLATLRNISSGELQSQIKAMHSRYNQFRQSQGTGLAYQNFTSQLQTTWGRIWSGIVRDLVGLQGPLTELSKSLGKAADTLLRSPELKKGIKAFGEDIQSLAKYLISPSFQQGLANFVSEVGGLAHFLGFTSSLVNPIGAARNSLIAQSQRSSDSIWNDIGADAAKKYGIDPNVLHAQYLALQKTGEILNPYWIAGIDKRGANLTPRQQLAEAFIMYYLNKHYTGIEDVARRHFGIYNPKHLEEAQAYERKEMMGVHLTIKNQTGASVNASVNQLAPIH